MSSSELISLPRPPNTGRRAVRGGKPASGVAWRRRGRVGPLTFLPAQFGGLNWLVQRVPFVTAACWRGRAVARGCPLTGRAQCPQQPPPPRVMVPVAAPPTLVRACLRGTLLVVSLSRSLSRFTARLTRARAVTDFSPPEQAHKKFLARCVPCPRFAQVEADMGTLPQSDAERIGERPGAIRHACHVDVVKERKKISCQGATPCAPGKRWKLLCTWRGAAWVLPKKRYVLSSA